MIRTRMFYLSDLLFMLVPGLAIGLVVTAVVWNLISSDGEPIPTAGWVTASISILACIAVVVIFYVDRWRWVRKHFYTVRGVHYFYEDGAKRYLRIHVETDINETINRWYAYYKEGGSLRLVEVELAFFIRGAVCIFYPEAAWTPQRPGWWGRRVTGLTTGNFMEVGQGGRLLKATAHKHELSHVHLNRYENRFVGEEESHALFKEVGV